jgi:hypothetical protein
MEIEQRKVWYRRYKNARHFCPAPGYNCPKIPLGGIGAKGPDYETVRIVRCENCHLTGRRALISWGLNLTEDKWPKIKQVLAFNVDKAASAKHAEIVLAVSV